VVSLAVNLPIDKCVGPECDSGSYEPKVDDSIPCDNPVVISAAGVSTRAVLQADASPAVFADLQHARVTGFRLGSKQEESCSKKFLLVCNSRGVVAVRRDLECSGEVHQKQVVVSAATGWEVCAGSDPLRLRVGRSESPAQVAGCIRVEPERAVDIEAVALLNAKEHTSGKELGWDPQLDETATRLDFHDHCLEDAVMIRAEAGTWRPNRQVYRFEYETEQHEWNRVVAVHNTPSSTGACTVRYRLECPFNDEGYRHAAVVGYKSCCDGLSNCTASLPDYNDPKTRTGLTWLTDHRTWKVCSTGTGDIIRTGVTLEESAAEWGVGAEILDLTERSTMGCMSATVTARQQIFRETYEKCPTWLKMAGRNFLSLDALTTNRLTTLLFGKHPAAPSFTNHGGVYDTYTTFMYNVMLHVSLRNYKESFMSADFRMAIPTLMRPMNKVRAFEVACPVEEIDQMDWWNRGGPFMDLPQACTFLIARNLEMADDVSPESQQAGLNTWDAADSLNMSRAEYTLSYFDPYQNMVGESVYPDAITDFSKLFKIENDMFKDGLEHELAFRGLGVHRVNVLAKPLTKGGETALYSIDLKVFGTLEKRSDFFGSWGADMAFSADGMPLVVTMSDGKEIWRHESSMEEWQYAKFVWRSSLINGITLVDHLWHTHFHLANTFAITSREMLPAAHPMRRLMAMFTWGTPFVNHGAVHELAGARGMLHRMTPFKDFGVVSVAATDLMLPFSKLYEPFANSTAYQSMPKILQDAPFYVDGRDFYAMISRFAAEYMSIFREDWCTPEGTVRDADITAFLDSTYAILREAQEEWTEDQLDWTGLESKAELAALGRYSCDGLSRMLQVMLFAVTGWHRHVGGEVADLMRDPDLSSPSWIKGNRHAQPRQHMQAVLIAATTGFTRPKLGNNTWGFMFEKMTQQNKAQQVVKSFEAEMAELVSTINDRNAARPIPYNKMHPYYVENSVAV